MLNVAVLGASGYAGAELVRILVNHPQCRIQHLLAHSNKGKTFNEVFPFFDTYGDLVMEDTDSDDYLNDSDMVFCALPHGQSAVHVKKILERRKKCVDLGADFRFRDVSVYESWYGKHPYKELCKDTVYGLVEIHRQDIIGKDFIANPGCYVTGATLALYPLLKEGLVDLGSIIVDSKSGISGAGRGVKEASLYCECSESIKAYGVASHRHTPEIEQNYEEAAGESVVINFTPHLTPMNRGILTTAYATLNKKGKNTDLYNIFEKYYKNEHFIRCLPTGKLPETKWVQGTNYVYVGYAVDPRTNRVIVVTAIDNLVKGAAGQAVQNMNLMCGFEETMGLKMTPAFP